MALVLLVDDDKDMLDYTCEYLEAKGLQTHACSRANLVMPFLANNQPDICLLDVQMPLLNGFELARQIKAEFPNIPFLFLSGQTSKEDRIGGLKLGADDYISKPFSLEELFLRIEIILNRRKTPMAQTAQSKVFYLGKIAFDSDYRQLSMLQNTIKLSAIENKLLTLLCTSANQTVAREALLENIWGGVDEYKSRSLNVYINKLRHYLESEPNIEIVNEHGRGYRLVFKQY